MVGLGLGSGWVTIKLRVRGREWLVLGFKVRARVSVRGYVKSESYGLGLWFGLG